MTEVPNLAYIARLSKGNSSFKKTLMNIIKRELPTEINAYESHLVDGNYSATASAVHKINHKIKILGLVNSCKIAEKYRMDLLDERLALKSDFESILRSLLVYIKGV